VTGVQTCALPISKETWPGIEMEVIESVEGGGGMASTDTRSCLIHDCPLSVE